MGRCQIFIVAFIVVSRLVFCQRQGVTRPFQCEKKPDVENGSLEARKGSRFLYVRCNYDFVLDGPSEVGCLQNGTWSEVGKCLPDPSLVNKSTCPEPPVLAHGSFLPGSRREGKNRIAECNGGYKLEGPEQITCGSDGNWTTIPTCVKDKFWTDCLSLPTIPNGALRPFGYQSVPCFAAQPLDWRDSMLCGSGGRRRRSIGGDAYYYRFFNSDDVSLMVLCEQGFKLTGPNTITCTNEGQWTTPGKCEKSDLIETPSTENAEVFHEGIWFKSP